MFQACEQVKPNPSIVFHMFQACVKMKQISSIVFCFKFVSKMKPSPSYLSWFPFYQPILFQMSLGFLIPSSPSAWPIIRLHLVVLPIPEEPLQWVALLASPLTFTCSEQFHHHQNQLLPLMPLIPPGGVNFQLFSDSQKLKRLSRLLSFWTR